MNLIFSMVAIYFISLISYKILNKQRIIRKQRLAEKHIEELDILMFKLGLLDKEKRYILYKGIKIRC